MSDKIYGLQYLAEDIRKAKEAWETQPNFKTSVEKFIESLPKITVNRRNYCGKYHREESMEYGGIKFYSCPNHPHNPMVTIVPLNK